MNTLFLCLIAGGLATLQAEESCDRVTRGMASWYGAECQRTASGERYDPQSMTAAHRSLPFGTMVAVKCLASGRSVTLRINNRGPFRKGRVIDISKGAAQRLGMIESGITKVEIAVLK